MICLKRHQRSIKHPSHYKITEGWEEKQTATKTIAFTLLAVQPFASENCVNLIRFMPSSKGFNGFSLLCLAHSTSIDILRMGLHEPTNTGSWSLLTPCKTENHTHTRRAKTKRNELIDWRINRFGFSGKKARKAVSKRSAISKIPVPAASVMSGAAACAVAAWSPRIPTRVKLAPKRSNRNWAWLGPRRSQRERVCVC